MIIDIHTHIFPDGLAPKALAVLIHNCGETPFLNATLKDLIGSMDRAGVDRSAIMPIATKPSQVQGINRWVREVCNQTDRIIGFASLHPHYKDYVGEINHLKADGVPGIKLHPDYQEFFVDDPEVLPFFKALADAGLLVLFHAGVDIGLEPPVHCTPDRLSRLLDAVPNLRVIAGHMGGYSMWDDVEKYLIGRDLYLDTSYSMEQLGTERAISLMKAHGMEKILFGTDSPWTEQSQEVSRIRSFPLKPEEISAILGGNAMRLLKIQ